MSKKETKELFPKSILKWVGGKHSIIKNVISNFPDEINNYHEIFLGGGTVLFSLLYYQQLKKIKINGNIYAYDYNLQLINLFNDIRDNPIELFDELSKIIEEYKKIKIENQAKDYKKIERRKLKKNPKKGESIYKYEKKYKPTNIQEALHDKESYYYWIRKQYNDLISSNIHDLKISALFIFLNKTCFRGLYRVGKDNTTKKIGFNVPYGNYKNPSIIEKDKLNNISSLIQNVTFIHSDFSHSLKNIKKGDFIYLDPPYVPEKKDSFTSYTNDNFNGEKHQNLFDKIKSIDEKFLMSNSYVKFVKDNFKSEKFKIEVITVRRSINSKNPESETKEVLIKNF